MKLTDNNDPNLGRRAEAGCCLTVLVGTAAFIVGVVILSMVFRKVI